jgi:hypothetical protein
MNGIQVGFPYVMQFFAERMAKRNAAAPAQAAVVPEPAAAAKLAPVQTAAAVDADGDEVLLN